MPAPSGPGPPGPVLSALISPLCPLLLSLLPRLSPLETVSATRADPGLHGSLLLPSTPGRRLPVAPRSGHPAPKSPFSTFPVVPSPPSPASPSLPAGPGRLSLCSCQALSPPPPCHPVLGPCSESMTAHLRASLVTTSSLDGVLHEGKDISAVLPLSSSLADMGSVMHKQRPREGP